MLSQDSLSETERSSIVINSSNLVKFTKITREMNSSISERSRFVLRTFLKVFRPLRNEFGNETNSKKIPNGFSNFLSFQESKEWSRKKAVKLDIKPNYVLFYDGRTFSTFKTKSFRGLEIKNPHDDRP